MVDSYTRQRKIEDAANSEVKLTKAGEKYTKASVSEIKAKISNVDDVNYNELIGIATNPRLPSDSIRDIFAKLRDIAHKEKNNDSMSLATKTKNVGQREKIRRLLQEHPNLDDDAFESLILKYKNGTGGFLKNPAIKEKHLQLFFDNHVIDKTGKSGYSYLMFIKVMNSKNVTTKLFMEWYNRLKKFADWTFSDSSWYAILQACLERDDCPHDILVDIVSVPPDGQNGWRSSSERYRNEALEHKNASADLKILAYEATENEKYLPDIVKDVFIF